MPGAYYSPAPSVATIGRKIINSFHPHLRGTRVEFLYRSEANRKGGKSVLGTAEKITGKNAILSTPDVGDDESASSEGLDYFLITISRDLWQHLEEFQREALVDHELCHCTIEVDDDGMPKLVLVAHDVEEFNEVVYRHGLWLPDLTRFIRAIGPDQLSLWSEKLPEDPIDPVHLDYARNEELRVAAKAAKAQGRHLTAVKDPETGEMIRSDEGQLPAPPPPEEEPEPPFFTE